MYLEQDINYPGKCYRLYKSLTVFDANAMLMSIDDIGLVPYWRDSLSGG